MALPLEDSFNDIIGKAMRGQKLSPTQIADDAGISPEKVKSLTEGEWDAAAARSLAPVLGLKPDALVASGERAWAPEPIALEGLAQFTTPWEDMMVNSYLVWDTATREAVAFDSGADCSPILERAAREGVKITHVLLTHTHGDHVYDLDRLVENTKAKAFVGEREPLDGAQSFAAGETFTVGHLTIETRLTWGHSKGGITYVVHGLARPVAIVGDAIFAGSMGGGMVSYADALATNRAEILTLPDDTIICSGHGPLTTVGEQKQYNPFFP